MTGGIGDNCRCSLCHPTNSNNSNKTTKMKETPPNKQLVSVPLDKLVTTILGDNHYVPIDPQLAEAIYLVCRNKVVAYVQFPSDKDINIIGQPISQPYLWQLGKWYESTERWMKSKLRAEEERKARFVAEANIQRITAFLLRTTELERPFAEKLAIKWVTANEEQKYIRMGGKPFIKTVEEI